MKKPTGPCNRTVLATATVLTMILIMALAACSGDSEGDLALPKAPGETPGQLFPIEEFPTETSRPTDPATERPARHSEPRTPGATTPEPKDISRDPEASPEPANATREPESPASMADANNTFGWDLYHQLAETEDNIWFSPISIHTAVAMIYTGAFGETAAQMRQAMGYPETTEETGRQSRQIMNILTQAPEKHQKGSLQLTVANSVWGQGGHPFLEEYKQSLETYYGAPLREANFDRDPEGAASRINDWVSKETKDRISELFPPRSINSDTTLVLANAVYFKAGWDEPFENRKTRPDAFTNRDGSTVTVAMMHQSETMAYHQGDGYQALAMAFDGNQTDMLIILPDQGRYQEVEAALNDGAVQDIREALSPWDLTLWMPRLELNDSIGLVKLMRELGMTDLFDAAKADFSGMDGQNCVVNPMACLYVSHAQHKSFVKIDEEGTEAADATGLVMRAESTPPDYPDAEMRIDRPFIMIIKHWVTGVDLFTGRVTRVTPEIAGDTGTTERPTPETNGLKPPILPTEMPEENCDQILQNQLIFQRLATTPEKVNRVILEVQLQIENCNAQNWNPQADDSHATERCWSGELEAPPGLYDRDTGRVRLTSGRDHHNNRIVYWSQEEAKRPTDDAPCWMYTSRLNRWS